MNMEVNSVGKSPAGLARKRRGTKAHLSIKGSPPLSSTKKNRTFNAINAYVTTGTVLSAVLSSPIGNIGFVSLYSGFGTASHQNVSGVFRRGGKATARVCQRGGHRKCFRLLKLWLAPVISDQYA